MQQHQPETIDLCLSPRSTYQDGSLSGIISYMLDNHPASSHASEWIPNNPLQPIYSTWVPPSSWPAVDPPQDPQNGYSDHSSSLMIGIPTRPVQHHYQQQIQHLQQQQIQQSQQQQQIHQFQQQQQTQPIQQLSPPLFSSSPSQNDHNVFEATEIDFYFPEDLSIDLEYLDDAPELLMEVSASRNAPSASNVTPSLSSPMSSQVKTKNTEKAKSRSEPVACPTCGTKFKLDYYLQKHISSVHENIRTHTCPICSFSFCQKGHLKTHIKTVHFQVKPYRCELCERVFASNSAKKKHFRLIHEKERPYQCQFCDSSYVQKCRYQRHLQRHHPEAATQ